MNQDVIICHILATAFPIYSPCQVWCVWTLKSFICLQVWFDQIEHEPWCFIFTFLAQSRYVCSKSISIQSIVHNTHAINKVLLVGVVYPSYHAFKNSGHWNILFWISLVLIGLILWLQLATLYSLLPKCDEVINLQVACFAGDF